jgi:hypothetical protein
VDGIFQPARRVLTEEQFAQRVNGTILSYEHTQALRKSCGLPCDEKSVSPGILQERLAASAWREVMGNLPLEVNPWGDPSR